MRRVLLLAVLPALLPAADTWVKFTSGPYEVLTYAGPRAGRETIVRLYRSRRSLEEAPPDRTACVKTPAEEFPAAKRHLAAQNFHPTYLAPPPIAHPGFPDRAASDAHAKLARADRLSDNALQREY